MKRRNNSPCYKCMERREGCHSVCAAYLAMRKELERQREKMQEHINERDAVYDTKRTVHQRAMSKTKRRG